MSFIKKNSLLLLLIIPALLLVAFMIIPLVNLFSQSVITNTGFTLEFFSRFFSTPLYTKILFNTLKLSFIVSFVCLILGFPVAYVMHKSTPVMRIIINTIIQIPFWTSLLVRAYAWTVMLQRQGVINSVLLKFEIITEPIMLYKNTFGLVIGMAYILLPYMIFSLNSVMDKIDNNLITASINLGAGKTKTFFKIFFPLSMPGVVAGFSIVFLSSLGYYVVPSLLGGSNDTTISQLIQTQISRTLDWNFASAISIVLIAVTLVIMLISQRVGVVKGTNPQK